jgi:hypothetical protein
MRLSADDGSELGTRTEPQLRQRVRHVVLHRLAGQEEPSRDIDVGRTIGYQSGDFPLAIR